MIESPVQKRQIEMIFIQILIQKLVHMLPHVQITSVQIGLVLFNLIQYNLIGSHPISSTSCTVQLTSVTDQIAIIVMTWYNRIWTMSYGLHCLYTLSSIRPSFSAFINEGDNVL